MGTDDDDMDELPDIREEVLEEGIVVKDHVEKDSKDECGYCGQLFGPDDIVIEKTIHGKLWCFCSEECYHDFLDASNFKDDEFEKEKQANSTPEYPDDKEERPDEEKAEEDF
jgi:hypothetical protein